MPHFRWLRRGSRIQGLKGLSPCLTFGVGLFLVAVAAFPCLAGPYPPAAGKPGSKAIHMDDSAFVGWATGWRDYNVGTNVDANWQTPDLALGKAAGTSFDIVSLGRGGSITLTFDNPITNGDGWDFAVFENSFNDTFLELAYVEVSSDGVNFYRFDNNSLTTKPVNGFGAVNPTNIIGFAGKYRQGYGTPFDLHKDWFTKTNISGLDLSRVTHVRIVDIIGSGSYRDSFGYKIYDPYPTAGSAGFDLDAVGIINAAAGAIAYVNPDGACGSHSPCYEAVSTAIIAVSSGTEIRMVEGAYKEDVALNAKKNLKLTGGWNTNYSAQPSRSTLNSLTIQKGRIEIDKVDLRP